MMSHSSRPSHRVLQSLTKLFPRNAQRNPLGVSEPITKSYWFPIPNGAFSISHSSIYLVPMRSFRMSRLENQRFEGKTRPSLCVTPSTATPFDGAYSWNDRAGKNLSS
jgi:hypothetical protein